MNKKIKFRGKTKQGKWVIGYYVGKLSLDEVAILPPTNVNYDICCINDSECYYCMANTLGQFTGLYDCHGKEIYEGDIVKWDVDNRLYLVTFWGGMFYASIVKDEGISMIGGFPLHRLTNHVYELCKIVGNRYDNPELLKGGEE